MLSNVSGRKNPENAEFGPTEAIYRVALSGKKNGKWYYRV